jgi:ATP-dependent Clp protease ATP-binding subunit ClpC
MQDRFTEQVRQVLRFAEQEANDLYCDYLGTEHLLLGLIREETGIAARILKDRGIDLRRLRREVGNLVELGPETVVSGPRPVTPMAQRVLTRAQEEAGDLPCVDTGHLLLGLLRDTDSLAAQVLLKVGLEPDAVRREVVAVLRNGARTGEGSSWDERSAIQLDVPS